MLNLAFRRLGIRRRSDAGLSLIELAIGVLIMGVLVAVVVPFVFNGLGGTSKDQVRMESLRQISQAMSLYSVRHGDMMGRSSGCGSQGHGNGWVGAQSAQYPVTIAQCLQAEGLLAKGVETDPVGVEAFGASARGGPESFAYMKYSCNPEATVVYVFARLESYDADPMPASGVCEGFSNLSATSARTSPFAYGMNYYVRVEVAS